MAASICGKRASRYSKIVGGAASNFGRYRRDGRVCIMGENSTTAPDPQYTVCPQTELLSLIGQISLPRRAPFARRLGLRIFGHFDTEDLRQVAGIEDLCSRGALAGAGQTLASLGDEILVIDIAEREQQVGLLIQPGANSIEHRRDL